MILFYMNVPPIYYLIIIIINYFTKAFNRKCLILHIATTTKRHIVWIFTSQEPLVKQSNHVTYVLLRIM